MSTVNIALNIKNLVQIDILNNKLNFENNHILHISLLQFYTKHENIYLIKNKLKGIILPDFNFEFKFIKNKIDDMNYIYQINIKSLDLIKFQKSIYNQFNKFIFFPEPKEENLKKYFYEKITYEQLPLLVLNYNNNEYNPHITIGISDSNQDINEQYINEQDIDTKDLNLNLDLFKIGDFGTAIPIIDTFYYAHRINTKNELNEIPINHGIELDLRDKDDQIILAHDPFNNGELFDDFLKEYNNSSIILNIKSERIEFKVLELLKKYNVTNYLFLDCSFPMIYLLNKQGENNIAIRFSEFESIESVLLVKDMIKWVWIDCFNKFPLNKECYTKIKEAGLKICLVSPELQGHKIEKIQEFKNIICYNNFEIDAICTKVYNINKWMS